MQILASDPSLAVIGYSGPCQVEKHTQNDLPSNTKSMRSWTDMLSTQSQIIAIEIARIENKI